MISLIFALKAGGAVLAFGGGAFGFATKRSAYKAQKRVQALEAEAKRGKFLTHYTPQEIAFTVKGYVQPSCSPLDPANADDEGYLADIREPVFDFMDRAITEAGSRNYVLLLADSGMGKTSFCISYRAHLLQQTPNQDVAVISLSMPSCDRRIASIPNKSSCILLLDALDEDVKAISDGRKRLEELLEMASDFQSVVITCRSQFFSDDHAIPVETPIRRAGPRAHGQNQNASLKRFYLSPFDDRQVKRYINRHFPLWNVKRLRQRARAFELVRNIPELAIRPMLLERLPEIARGQEDLQELYQLYEFMVRGWADRERGWIPQDKLLAVSREIAVSLFAQRGQRTQRISRQELDRIANAHIQGDPDWDHLKTRSLLNRGSNGMFKFAHLSIMEFFVVEAALDGDIRALAWPWTPFMKQLFISWGYYRHSALDLAKARNLLSLPASRTAIRPLSDYWALPAQEGVPNFKQSATRRTNAFGSHRLAIPQWRDANISVDIKDGEVIVEDHEFFLTWQTFTNISDEDVQVPMPLVRAQSITEKSSDKRLPSYDEFISLVEGLALLGQSDILSDLELYPISDTPGKMRHLFVSLGKARDLGSLVKILDKERLVSVTDRTITCYETGQKYDAKYASKLKVRPWWIKVI